MHYLIDGYNVINSNDKFYASTLNDRRKKLIDFIQLCRPHGSINNHATVVFDFKLKYPCGLSGYEKFHVGDIEIIFSNGILSADDIIVELVDESQNPYEITVITNDKGLCRRISASGARHKNVEVFLDKGFNRKNTKKIKECFDANEDNVITDEFAKLWLKK
ncbi:MAG: NYN domain-containing protein [Endomicrobium sp.]|jgi:predicted RNA-binding protein with PIN domain|nr:NYN domain-containing protein [Endomicrobium sp.]